MASKYDPWDVFFAQLDGDEHVWTLDEFEALTGVRLPPSAWSDAPWWSNTTYWAKWARHGWFASPRLDEGRIRFGRSPAQRGRPPGGSQQTPQVATVTAAPARRPVEEAPPESEGVILVGCVSQKIDVPAPAKDLYASDLWAKRRSYAEASGRPWFVLSAKHGVLHPDQVIEPYDVSLASASRSTLREWSDRVAPRLVELAQALGVRVLEVHAGDSYTPPALVQRLADAGIAVERPLAGLRIGEQKAWYLDRQPDGPIRTTPSVLSPPVADADTEKIVAQLLAFDAANPSPVPEVAVFVPDNTDAESYLRQNPFAFLTAVIFDQGIVAERAWEAPWLLRQRLGHFDLQRLAGDAGEIAAAVAQPPALHRYVNNVPGWVSAAARRVLTDYDGNAAAIWNDRPTAAELQRRFEAFVGIGPKKAAMAVEILIRHFGVDVEDLTGTNVAYDIHVRRVFLRTGLAQVDDQSHMLDMARRYHPERPGALDGPAWTIGREWCHPSEPDCAECVLAAMCPRLVERGDTVKGA